MVAQVMMVFQLLCAMGPQAQIVSRSRTYVFWHGISVVKKDAPSYAIGCALLAASFIL